MISLINNAGIIYFLSGKIISYAHSSLIDFKSQVIKSITLKLVLNHLENIYIICIWRYNLK